VRITVASGLLVFGAALPARAQATAQIPLQFNFLDPGARSLAMGSAFTAVADDATAAFTNPAGLTFLVKPEVSAEIRYQRLATPFLSGGRISGTVTNQGVDTINGPVYTDSLDAAARPYFFSFVYTWKRGAVAFYRHELVHQENSFSSDGVFNTAFLGGVPVNVNRTFALAGSRSIAIDNYGGSVAFRFADAFSAGVGVAVYNFSLASSFAQHGFQGGNAVGTVDPNQTYATATQNGSGTKAAVNAGAIWTASQQVRFGAVFRQGTSFDFTQVDTVPGQATLTRSGQFRTPHVFGAGVRVAVSDSWSFSADYDRVLYSRLKTDFIDIQASATNSASRLSIPDANEVHVGTEIVLTGVAHTPALRGGVWWDPDHSVHYQSDGSGSQGDVLNMAYFPGGNDQVHYCVGFGMPLSPAFEFNVGADLAKQAKYASASIVARFGK